MLVEFAKEEEEENAVKITVVGGGTGRWQGRFGTEKAREVREDGQEVAGDEEGFLVEREGVEVVDSDGEEGR